MTRALRFLLVVIGLVTLLTGTLHGQARGLGRINGIVVSEAGEPLDGVIIRAPLVGGGLVEGKSDASGNWVLVGIGRGEWHVAFEKPGFAPRRLVLVVEKEMLKSDTVKVVMKKM